jgi:23S rRNA (guanosine2251-2'-O)-methyltransferase
VEWIYGRHVARLALAAGAKRRPRRLAATAAALAALDRHDVAVAGIPQELCDGREIERLTGAREHQGVALQVAGYPYVDGDRLAARELVVVLDEVTDPHNVGAVARTALAVGVDGLVLLRHRSAAVTPAVVKASAGATEHLDIARVVNVVAYLKQLKEAGFWVYGAAGDATTSYLELDYGGKVALVFGSEGRGLRPLVRRACDACASLPVAPAVGSLNVSVAAAVFLYEARRGRL